MESTGSATPPVLLSLRGITLDYNEFRALSEVDLDVLGGHIHAIGGEHGAGKSSLAAIMSGLQRPQHGSVLALGYNAPQYTLKSAQAAGVRMIYQQTFLNDYFPSRKTSSIRRDRAPAWGSTAYTA